MMHKNNQWQQKHNFSHKTPATATTAHHGHSNIIAIGEGVEKAEYGNIEESLSRQSQSSNISGGNGTFFGRATDRPISAPPPMSFDLGGSSLLRNLGNGSVDGIDRNRGGKHLSQQESSWSAAGSADKRIFAGRNSSADNDGGGSYNSLGSLDQPHRAMYDFGNDPTVNNSNNRSGSSPLTDIMGSRAPPGLVGFSSNNHGSNNNQHIISSSDSSSTYDHDAVGMAIPRPASTGLIGHSQKHHHHQHQIYQRGEVRNVKSSPGIVSLGLIQFDGIRATGESGSAAGSGGGSTGGGVKHKSVMDWIQEDFPKTSSPVYSDTFNQNGTDATCVGGGSGCVSLANERGTHNAQHYDSSSMAFDAKFKSSQAVTAVYDTHAQPYEPTSISHGTINQTPVASNLQSISHHEPTSIRHMPHSSKQQLHNDNVASNQRLKQPGHIPSLSSMTNNAHHHPHHMLSLSNYDPQQQTIYYDDHSRGSQGDKERPGGSIPSHPPHIIQTTTSSASGNGPPHHPHPPPPPHAVYLNSVPSYGGYTTVYHHGLPPHPHHHPHHPPPPHPYTTISSPPSILHASPQTTTAAVDPSMIHHSSPTSTPTPLSPEYISLPANGTYVYWQPPAHAHPISHHPHHHHPPTVAVVDSNGQPTGISVSTGPPLPLTDSINKRQQHVRKGQVGNVGTGKNPGRKTNGHRGAKKATGGRGVDKDSVDYVSTLLDGFHLGKSRSWTTHDVKGHIVAFCQDQNGSRFIQQRLEIATDTERQLVLSEVLPSVRGLRNDVFGNYVVQKLFDHGNNKIKSELKSTLEGEVLQLSTQMYGCRVVQKALECVDEEDLLSLLQEFRGHVITCIHDQNGNHVIQKCIEVISIRLKMIRANGGHEGVHCDNNDYDDTAKTKERDNSIVAKRANQFQYEMESIVNCVLANAASLSCHPYGCRVLQRILEHCTDDLKTRALDTIRNSHDVLLDDQYGNYVIQHVLQFGRDDDRDSILSIVVESGLLILSRQKFASNVVEKLLKFGNGRTRNRIVREMLKVVEGKDTTPGSGDSSGNGSDGSSSIVLLMVRDAYANYVVQTTLDVVPEGEEKRLLLEELNRNTSLLRNYTFAKHIVTKLGSTEAGGI